MTAALQPQPVAGIEHPIIFSGPMVRAILTGTKSQTRRLVKVPPRSFPGAELTKAFADKAYGVTPCLQVPCADGSVQRLRNPWGFPASVETERGMERVPTRLWVRETWAKIPYPPSDLPRLCRVGPGGEGATWKTEWPEEPTKYKWRPSIHMPRWASRLTLEVTEVRAERLQSISEEDARAEGAETGPSHRVYPSKQAAIVSSYRAGFEFLWDSINGDRDRADWAANPWVWVVTFRVLP